MHLRLFRAIDDREESLAAFRLLEKRLQMGAQVFPDHLIGWQGGSRRHTVYWVAKSDVWAVLEPSPPEIKKGPRQRFWNCFGIGDPADRQVLMITVEINPPHEEVNQRLAGLFARDEQKRIYLAHTGKVGGGRKGIGQAAFRKFFEDHPWNEIETQGGERVLALVLGPIDSADFVAQLAHFVHSVADFKKYAVESATGG